MRKPLTITLTFLAGAYFLFEFLLPAKLPGWLGGGGNPLSPYLNLATDLVIVLGTMAVLLGPINLARVHLANLVRRRPGWSSSLVVLVFLFGSAAAAAGKDLFQMDWATALWGAPASQLWAHHVTGLFNVLFYGVNFAFGTTSIGILTFYLISAAYRSFRLSGLDSAVMFVAASIILLGRASIGDWLTQGLPDALQLHSIVDWLFKTPSMAVQRAVLIGAFAGAFAASLRYWLSLGTRTAE